MLNIFHKLHQAEDTTISGGASDKAEEKKTEEAIKAAAAEKYNKEKLGTTASSEPIEFNVDPDIDKQTNQHTEKLHNLNEKAEKALNFNWGHTDNWILSLLRTLSNILAANPHLRQYEQLYAEIKELNKLSADIKKDVFGINTVDGEIKKLEQQSPTQEILQQIGKLKEKKTELVGSAKAKEKAMTERLNQMNQTSAYYERNPQKFQKANLYTKGPKFLSKADLFFPGITLLKSAGKPIVKPIVKPIYTAATATVTATATALMSAGKAIYTAVTAPKGQKLANIQKTTPIELKSEADNIASDLKRGMQNKK